METILILLATGMELPGWILGAAAALAATIAALYKAGQWLLKLLLKAKDEEIQRLKDELDSQNKQNDMLLKHVDNLLKARGIKADSTDERISHLNHMTMEISQPM